MIDIIVIKAWLRKRWDVHSIGHPGGEHFWLASFASETDALAWTKDHNGSRGQLPPTAENKPTNIDVGNIWEEEI